MAGVDEVRSLLALTPVPAPLADALLHQAPELWLAGESPDVIAGDVALCHPTLGPGEVRVQVSASALVGVMRVSLLARDRPGLLATTTGALAADGLSIVQAAAMTWLDRGWALQRVLVSDPTMAFAHPGDLDLLRARLRTAVTGPVPVPETAVTAGPAEVSVSIAPGGRRLVHVAAPDRLGLLAAISAGLDQEGCNIVVARAEPFGEVVVDRFLVEGEPDGDRLAAYLSGGSRNTVAPAEV